MTKIRVDFSNVEESSNAEVQPGKYKARIEEVTKEEGQKAPYLKWKLKITNGQAKGLHINHITSLSPSALFNLRDTLIALGISVPKSAVVIDPNKFVGKILGIDVVMRPYEGKDYPNVKKVYAIDSMPEVVETDSLDDDDEVSIDLDWVWIG